MKMIIEHALTTTELVDLDRLEAVIERGQQAFLEVAGAAVQIRERRLYRRDYDSFQAYCQMRWKWSRSRVDQLIQSATAVDALPPPLAAVIVNERQAREVAKVEPERRAAVVEAAAGSGSITARSLATAAKPPGQTDKCGLPIPAALLPFWSRRIEMLELAAQVAKLKLTIGNAIENDDPLWRWLQKTSVTDAQNLYNAIKHATPHAVCCTCQGRVTDTCSVCKGTGFISEFFWNQCVPSEDKALRAKQINDKLTDGGCVK